MVAWLSATRDDEGMSAACVDDAGDRAEFDAQGVAGIAGRDRHHEGSLGLNRGSLRQHQAVSLL